MTGKVRLRLGNMFDGPSDLIVLPCSTAGSVTNFVEKTLRNFKIPSPHYGMNLGDVEIMPFTGAENVAQFVAFAASVENMVSIPTAIERIGEQVGRFTVSESLVRTISAPLLGAGAGGLMSETVVQSLRQGFLSQASPESTLTINILHKNVFDRLRNKLGQTIESRDRRLRVFISYTPTEPEHTTWVENLGKFLRYNGIEARLDRWHLRHGMDLTQWMCNEIRLANKVIIVSNAAYVERADGRHGGVGWETMIIQGDMFALSTESTKYIVIVRSEEFQQGIPFYLKTKFAIHWPKFKNENQLRQELLNELFEVDSAPSIGEEPVFI